MKKLFLLKVMLCSSIFVYSQFVGNSGAVFSINYKAHNRLISNKFCAVVAPEKKNIEK